MIRIDDNLSIPEAELVFTASRSSGPGGQHANTSSTRVTLWFHVDASPSLNDAQRQRIRRYLRKRINREGWLHVTAQDSRSQSANRRAATARFTEMLGRALQSPSKRIPTRRPKSADRFRLEEKRRQSLRKKHRSWRPSSEDF